MPPEDRPQDDAQVDRLQMAIYEVLCQFDIRYPDGKKAGDALREFANAIIDEAVRKAIEP